MTCPNRISVFKQKEKFLLYGFTSLWTQGRRWLILLVCRAAGLLECWGTELLGSGLLGSWAAELLGSWVPALQAYWEKVGVVYSPLVSHPRGEIL